MTGINLEAWNPYTFTNAKETVTLLVLLLLAGIMAGMTLAPRPYSKRLIVWPLLLFWVFTILSATFLGRIEDGDNGQKLKLELFWTFRKAWTEHRGLHWFYIIGNILLFVPLGFLLPLTGRRMQGWRAVTVVGAALSLVIELTQYVTGMGLCELDDLLHNTWGAFMGYQMFLAYRYLAGPKRGERRWHRGGWLPIIYLVGMCTVFALLLFFNRPDWTGVFY